MITQARLKEVLHYSPETGEFTWLLRQGNVTKGVKAGRTIQIDRSRHLASRLAWVYMTGNWPKHLIDHINVDDTDNRFCNLREATHSQNIMNVKRLRHNTSGFKGVHLYRDGKRFVGQLTGLGGRYLGLFDTAREAAIAVGLARLEAHGEYARFE